MNSSNHLNTSSCHLILENSSITSMSFHLQPEKTTLQYVRVEMLHDKMAFIRKDYQSWADPASNPLEIKSGNWSAKRQSLLYKSVEGSYSLRFWDAVIYAPMSYELRNRPILHVVRWVESRKYSRIRGLAVHNWKAGISYLAFVALTFGSQGFPPNSWLTWLKMRNYMGI